MIGMYTPRETNKFAGVLRGTQGDIRALMPSSPIDTTVPNIGYLNNSLNGKLDKVTSSYKIYGTDGSGNQKTYQTGWSATPSTIQLMDQSPNGIYNDDGSTKSGGYGTYMVAIPSKPSHSTPKKWVEDKINGIFVLDGTTLTITTE